MWCYILTRFIRSSHAFQANENVPFEAESSSAAAAAAAAAVATNRASLTPSGRRRTATSSCRRRAARRSASAAVSQTFARLPCAFHAPIPRGLASLRCTVAGSHVAPHRLAISRAGVSLRARRPTRREWIPFSAIAASSRAGNYFMIYGAIMSTVSRNFLL